MSKILLAVPQWFLDSGVVNAGGLIQTFSAGTTNPLATWSESTGTSLNQNPVQLSGAGRAQIWLSPVAYKFVVQTAAGVTIMTIDNYDPTAVSTTLASLTSTGDVTLQQATAATSGANQSSNNLKVQATYWDGAASQVDQWNIQDVLGTGSNPTSTLTVTHSGSSGAAKVSIPGDLAIVGVVTAGSEKNTGGLGSLATAQTVTTSSISNPALSISRIDNSPPVSGAGILNPYLAPMVRFDLTTSSGGVTGANTGLLINMPAIKGKEVTTTTQVITGSGVAQSVSVVDSSVFTQNDVATIDLNQGSGKTENVTITAITDGTHVTGVFTLNHSNGAKIFVVGKGDKIGFGVSIADQSGNTDNLFAENLNITATTAGAHWYLGSEIDVTNSMGVDGGGFIGDATPYVAGLSVVNVGNNNSSVGVGVGVAAGTQRFLNGINIESAKNNGLVIASGPNNGPTTGIAITGAQTNGIAIGTNQTISTNPNNLLNDPTVGLFLTSKGTGAAANSNTVRFQERIASVNHTGDFQLVSSQLKYNYDAGATYASFDNDGSISVQNAFRVRDNGTNTTRGTFIVSGTSSIITSDVHQTNGTVAAGGDFRLKSASTIAFRNNGNTADVVLGKDTSDRLTFAGGIVTAGVGSTSQKAESAADANVLTVTPPAIAGTYRLNFVLDVSAATAATLGWTATWKDSNGNAQSPTNLTWEQSGSAAPALTFVLAASGVLYGTAIISIDNTATNIVIKLTFTGTSFAANASATIERMI